MKTNYTHWGNRYHLKRNHNKDCSGYKWLVQEFTSNGKLQGTVAAVNTAKEVKAFFTMIND